MSAARLSEAVSALCPIYGLSVGRLGQSASVRVDFRPEATPEQRAAAQAAVDAFDWSPAAGDAWLDSQEADLAALRDLSSQAVADINAYLVVADGATAAQVRAEVKAIDQRQRAVIKALMRVVRRTWR